MPKRLLLTAGAMALMATGTADGMAKSYPKPADDTYPRQVFWGDTHLHTRMSADAYNAGNRTVSPEEAFRFARGETVTAQNGMKVKLARPLDFLVVSDHAEYLGIIAGVEDGNEQIVSSSLGAKLKALFDLGTIEDAIRSFFTFFTDAVSGAKPENVELPVRQSIWDGVGERADRFNQPGRFTAFIGYEYTSIPGMKNLHRNVIFRDDATRTSQVVPFSTIDSENPEDLWNYLAEYERKTGGSVLAIPHNSNLSQGLMFDETQYNGDPITAAYARTRIRWEPVHEMTQIKGDSETHPFLSPTDEFADYEIWNSWIGKALMPGMSKKEWPKTMPGAYARSALKRGLQIEQKVGVNPYKFGMIGSTDSHTSLATAEEDNFWGKMGPGGNPSAGRWKGPWGGSIDLQAVTGGGELNADDLQSLPLNWTTAASGLAAVWARENTREALFDAMRRKEVYATTGTRIGLRFFGGWNFPQGADKRSDYVDIGYGNGVPMGGDLTAAAEGKAPRFILMAAKDPDGANLDRIQVVKGWVDGAGKAHEKVYDVAWSGTRKRDAKTGKLEAVGSTVDLASATYSNTIGSPVLSATWSDPDFDSKLRAFYYVRVLEIPTPRWTGHDAAFFKLTLPDFIPTTTQERAYSSPIWYTP